MTDSVHSLDLDITRKHETAMPPWTHHPAV